MDRDLLLAVRDALEANGVFHTPIALRRKLAVDGRCQWDEFEIDAITRTRETLALVRSAITNSRTDG